MPEADFYLTFSDLADAHSPVLCRDNTRNLDHVFGLRVDDRQVSTIRAEDERSVAFDLIDLAAALYVSDWLASRSLDYPSQIHVSLPLRCPDVFTQQSIYEALQYLLHWYTEDHWNFDFNLRSSPGRLAERRSRLWSAEYEEVALWSGGLDSLAGLCSRWFSSPIPTGQLLVGTGGNDYAFRRQRVIAKAVEQRLSANIELVRLRISPRKIAQIPKHNPFRVRGLVFVLVGLAIAYLEGHSSLSVYENGIGALNLPLSQAEIGLAHARSVHPKSLHLISGFGEAVFGRSLDVRNPFLFSTKAQICEVFVEHPEFEALIEQTITCDRPPRLPGVKHCGCCTSCLLRRQALAVLGIADATRYAVFRDDYEGDHRHKHLPAMIEQVGIFRDLLVAQNPRDELISFFPQLLEVELLLPDSSFTHLVALLHRYTCEWANIGDTLNLNRSS